MTHRFQTSKFRERLRVARFAGLQLLTLAVTTASFATNVLGQTANDSAADSPSAIPRPLVLKFESADEPLSSKAIIEPGPRPPLYPGFPDTNRSLKLEAKSSSIVIRDGGARTDLRFALGDSLTIEAWVRVDDLPLGGYAYIVGKGRNGREGYPENNQNYALRVKGEANGARLTFLFGSVGEQGQDRQWHRWTSREGLPYDRPWHHVAVSFTFGQADSLKGVIDGKEVAGDWDMAGKTSRGPIVDDDDVHIGSGNGGGAGNRLVGQIDELMIHRGVVPVDELKRRFSFSPQPPVVDRAKLPRGKVVVDICEAGVSSSSTWPALAPQGEERFETPAFGIVDIPRKYVDTGVRGDRANPLLLRAAAVVELPPGKHRWLLRARGLSRVFLDGQPLLSLGSTKGDSGGHGLVPKVDEYLNLGPTFRFAPPGTQEAWKELSIEGGEHLLVFETIVGGALGGSRLRPELGETVLAFSPEGSTDWRLIVPVGGESPGSLQFAYDDAGWELYAASQRDALDRRDAATRAKLREQFADEFRRRRDEAEAWLRATPEIAVPELPAGYPAFNAIDHFIAARITEIQSQRVASQAGTVDFFRDIQPILEATCWDCHKGGKSQGGLRLDSLVNARKGGDSGDAAITPGKHDASELLKRVRSTDPDLRMPPRGDRLTEQQIATLERWINEGANWPELRVERFELTPLCDDLTFLRRVTLDTVGVVPTLAEWEAFAADTGADKRRHAIDRLLADPRCADHAMGYWLDVLAENPNILNPTLNNTGPFRWWLYESLLDDKPLDLFVTELLRMRGSERFGGPAGFAVASQNDVPMAAKATIVSSAFLGVEMKCARCHDAPAHRSRQEELFQLAAMLAAQPVEVPATSSVPLDKLTEGGRKPLIQVTLKPGAKVAPEWPFEDFCDPEILAQADQAASDSRERLARLITTPANQRFAQVMANRVWQRLMGRGIVEPVEDWEKGQPSHPQLLAWLGREMVRGGYQWKHIARLILNSHAYQRYIDPALTEPSPLAIAPARRRLAAEQVVDSLFASTGKPFRLEEVSLDIDGRRDLKNSISLGMPRRSWMLTSTSNERDRPSLALPRVQAIVDVLQAFGWRGARQDPASHRESAPNALQPAILANGVAGVWLTRLSDDHGLTKLALEDIPLEEMVDRLYLRMLTRHPTDDELRKAVDYLSEGFANRRMVETRNANEKTGEKQERAVRQPERYVSWSNHLDPEATVIRQQQELAARRGDPPTTRLTPQWRERMEDVVWMLVNSPETVFTR